MKKFILVALVAVFTVASCTNQTVEDENQETAIRKDEIKETDI